MYSITDPYQKLPFEAMTDGTYFECEGKVYQKVKWEGESSYALDCEEALIMPPAKLNTGEFHILVMDPESNVKFRRVVGS